MDRMAAVMILVGSYCRSKNCHLATIIDYYQADQEDYYGTDFVVEKGDIQVNFTVRTADSPFPQTEFVVFRNGEVVRS